MLNASSVVDIAKLISQNSTPVLLLDTCAILDILRLFQRNQVNELNSIVEITNRAKTTPKDLHIILSSIIKTEYDENNKSVISESQGHFGKLKDSIGNINAGMKFWELSTFDFDFDYNCITSRLEFYCSEIFNNSLIIEDDNNCLAAATKRVTKCISPARKGKDSTKDCLIVEEYLATCNEINSRSQGHQLLFLSSNSNDFCISKTKDLKDDLEKEFKTVGIKYCYSWNHVLSEILNNKNQ